MFGLTILAAVLVALLVPRMRFRKSAALSVSFLWLVVTLLMLLGAGARQRALLGSAAAARGRASCDCCVPLCGLLSASLWTRLADPPAGLMNGVYTVDVDACL